MYIARSIRNFDRYSAPALITSALVGLLTLAATAQSDGQDYKTIRVSGQETLSGYLISWVDVSPDGSKVAVSATQGSPLRFYPMDKPDEATGIDVGNWYAGSRARYSTTGRYMLLQQLFYLDYAPNKDRPIKYEVIDVANGSVVGSFNDLYAAALTPDETTVLTVDKAGLKFTDLASGKTNAVRSMERTGNSVAVSTDGKRFAVAYDMATLQPIHSLPELFDKVFRLEYSSDGKDLWIHAKPHTRKGGNPNPNQSYVEVADARSGEMRRTSFPSLATFEPDFRISPDGTLFAIGSTGGKFQEVHLYDRSTGKMVDRFVVSWRLWENLDKGEFVSGDGRLSFTFLPDNKRIILTSGNRIIEWNYAP